MGIRFLPVLLAAALYGCAPYSPREVADPNAITIRDAFLSVSDGLQAFQNDLSKNPNFHLGVIVCEIVVKFNISATATRGGNVGVEVSPTSQFVQAKLSAQQTNNSSGDRGNSVEIHLNSIDTHVCPPSNPSKQTDAQAPAKTPSK